MFLLLLLNWVSPQETPQQARLLQQLIGSWTAQYQLHPGPMGPGGHGTGQLIARQGPGYSITMEFSCETGPAQGFSLAQILLWNPVEKQYELNWADSFSPKLSGIKKGALKGSEIVFEYSDQYQGTRINTKSVFTAISKSGFSIKSFRAVGDQPFQPSMDLHFKSTQTP